MKRANSKAGNGTGTRNNNSFRRLFEQLEDRRVMAYGSISLDAQGLLSIYGADGYNDSASISIDNRGTSSTYDDLVRVSLNNIGSPLSQQFQSYSVAKIQFIGYGGNDYFDNRSAIASDAWGGNGNDMLLGGWGIDRLIAGAGDDYCDGRTGNDQIWGEAGNDALFGDAGNDVINGGTGNDKMCGGNDRDSLFGNDGIDWLDGGYGTEIKMLGGRGRDRFYDKPASFPGNDINKYSGETDSTFNSYSAQGWFDTYLADAGVRSLARQYYFDGFITRSEMIGMFNEAQDGGAISGDELADLRDMTTSGVSMYASTRNLAQKVVYSDRANNWYQGSSLGNIYAGASAGHLQKLVSQWFYGGDRPTAFAGSTYTYVSGSLFVNGASYTDVDQEAAGTCYLLASLADISQHSPQTIYNMFTDNGDGTFTIRFFNGSKAEYITVDRYLPVQSDGTSQMAGFGGAYWQSTNELWVALIEKAYAQLNESGWINQDNTNTYYSIDAGWPDDAMRHVTGRSASRASLNSSSINTLISANNQGRAVSLWTYQTVYNSQLVTNHAYALLGYNSYTQRFTLYNPWNSNNGMPAIVELTASQLVQNFGTFAHVAV